MYVHVSPWYVYVHLCVCTSVSPEIDVRCLSLLLSTLAIFHFSFFTEKKGGCLGVWLIDLVR